jgi:hypothetical protein
MPPPPETPSAQTVKDFEQVGRRFLEIRQKYALMEVEEYRELGRPAEGCTQSQAGHSAAVEYVF